MACTDYNGNWYEALDASTMAIRDAVLCGFQAQLGGALFGAFILLGMVNLPIYIRTQSVIIPAVITLSVGGVVLMDTASIAQTILVAGLLFFIGIGPILVLRRIQR